jgi:ferredoxin
MPELFAAIGTGMVLYLPSEVNGRVNFTKWIEGIEYAQNKCNTVKSAKDFFFPRSENLAAFRTEGKNIFITPNESPDERFVLFGGRACDIRGLQLLDMVFLSDPADGFYQARRENAVIVTMACGAPEETCFCGVFGINPVCPDGDVAAWICGGTLYWDAKTQKGEELTQSLAVLFEDAGSEDLRALEQYQMSAGGLMEELPLNSLRPKELSDDLLSLFDSEVWEDLSQSCLGCGACTFVCPTCQCYDIQDYDTGHGILRFRCWDSCMYSDFTLMAHGNPRTSKLERFRQRFMHKLVYFPQNNDGMFSCVGCGRCVARCPVSLNIAKVINALGVKENVL